MFIVFLSCLFIRETVLTIKVQAAEGGDISPLRAQTPPKAVADLVLVSPLPQKPIIPLLPAKPKINTLMEATLKYYLDGSSVIYGVPNPLWDLVFLEALWKFSTLQGTDITAILFKPGPEQESKQLEHKCEPLREANLTFAFLVGVAHAAHWKGAQLEDVAAFVEKTAGFKEKEFQRISMKTFAASLAYQHNILMVLARLMGYQITGGKSVREGLDSFENLYSKTLPAKIVKDHRRSEGVNLEGLFVRVSTKFKPLTPTIKKLFTNQQKNFTGRRLMKDIWESEGVSLYTSISELPNLSLWSLSFIELSQEFAKREPEVISLEDEGIEGEPVH